MRYSAIHLGVACALLLVAGSAYADAADEPTRAAASTLGYAGVDAYQQGDFEGASERLEKAYALLKVPSLGLWSARAMVQRGRFVQASERLLEVSRLELGSGDVEIQRQAQQDAARELAELQGRLARVEISTPGAPLSAVELTLDGAPVQADERGAPIPVDPGRHVIEARDGARTVRSEAVLQEGQRARVVLRFAAAATPIERDQGDTPWRALGWTALGVGGASLLVGAVVGGSVLADRGQLGGSQTCDLDRNRCGPEERDRVEAYNAKRIVSGATLIGGGVLAAVGAYLVLFESPSEPESAPVEVRLAPDAVSVSGRF